MPNINFSCRYIEGVVPHKDDPMMINIQIHDWNVNRVFIDHDISPHILYWNAYEGLKIYPKLLHYFKGCWLGFQENKGKFRVASPLRPLSEKEEVQKS